MEQENTFKSISQLFDFSDIPTAVLPLSLKEQREILMREIYDFYKGEYDKRRKENWNRYCKWCRSNHKANTPENLKTFKRSKLYIREISFESMVWLLKHIPSKDLPYFTSTGKEFSHTGKNFSSWLSCWFPKKVI